MLGVASTKDNSTPAAAEKRYGAAHEDPLFARPLAFVDTSDIPQQRRREAHPSQDHSDPEGWGKSGYINRLEADLIADIVAVYQRHGLEWVVIVPYKAQAGLIRRHLRRRLDPSHDLNLEERVSTVDFLPRRRV